MVPEGWKKMRLGSASDVRDGTHDSPKAVESGFPLVTSKNLLKNGSLDLSNVSLISDEDFRQVNKRSEVHVGDILFGMIGTIGNPVLIKSEGFAIKNVALIKEKKELLNKYLIHCLNGSAIERQFHEQNMGGTQKFLSLGVIRDLEILAPNVQEQIKIAEILSTWDKSIEATERLLENSKKRKKVLMQQLLTRKKRLPGFSGTWETISLAEVADILIGGTPSRSNPKYWDSEKKTNNRWLSIANLNSDEISDTSEYLTDQGVKNSNVKLLPAGTIVMSFKLSIGKKAILKKPCYTNEAICGFVIRNNDLLVTSYLFHALETIDMTSEVDIAIKGATLNKEKLKGLLISLPEKDEQVAISQILDTASQEQKKIQLAVSRLKDEKAALMQQLLTGKKRVKVEEVA